MTVYLTYYYKLIVFSMKKIVTFTFPNTNKHTNNAQTSHSIYSKKKKNFFLNKFLWIRLTTYFYISVNFYEAQIFF